MSILHDEHKGLDDVPRCSEVSSVDLTQLNVVWVGTLWEDEWGVVHGSWRARKRLTIGFVADCA